GACRPRARRARRRPRERTRPAAAVPHALLRTLRAASPDGIAVNGGAPRGRGRAGRPGGAAGPLTGGTTATAGTAVAGKAAVRAQPRLSGGDRRGTAGRSRTGTAGRTSGRRCRSA